MASWVRKEIGIVADREESRLVIHQWTFAFVAEDLSCMRSAPTQYHLRHSTSPSASQPHRRRGTVVASLGSEMANCTCPSLYVPWPNSSPMYLVKSQHKHHPQHSRTRDCQSAASLIPHIPCRRRCQTHLFNLFAIIMLVSRIPFPGFGFRLDSQCTTLHTTVG
jgi:hypothetical protein